jgi:hypothetical protein
MRKKYVLRTETGWLNANTGITDFVHHYHHVHEGLGVFPVP